MFVHDPDTYLVQLGRDGKPEERSAFGVGICLPNCMTDRGCPKGTPDKPNSLNESNQQCYEFYKECRAVGEFPHDPVVRRNAAVIREVEDLVRNHEQESRHNDLIQLICFKGMTEDG